MRLVVDKIYFTGLRNNLYLAYVQYRQNGVVNTRWRRAKLHPETAGRIQLVTFLISTQFHIQYFHRANMWHRRGSTCFTNV